MKRSKLMVASLALGVMASFAAAQGVRRYSPVAGLGMHAQGSGNPVVRLSDDRIVIASEGGDETGGTLDDGLVVVRGFVSGQLSHTFLPLASLGADPGSLARRLVPLGTNAFLYSSAPIAGTSDPLGHLMVVTDRPGVALTVVAHDIRNDLRPNIEFQKLARLDARTLAWTLPGHDRLAGTADDVVALAENLGGDTFSIRTLAAGTGLDVNMVAAGANAAVCRATGPDGVFATADDVVVSLNRTATGFALGFTKAGCGLEPISGTGEPLVVGESVVFGAPASRTTNPIGASFVIASRLASSARISYTGSRASDFGRNAAFTTSPVALDADSMAYATTGRDGLFHTTDDEIRRVDHIGAGEIPSAHKTGVGLLGADVTLPPVVMAPGKVAWISAGADGVTGSGDDGIVITEGGFGAPFTATVRTFGVEAVALVAVNARTVIQHNVDTSMTAFADIGHVSERIVQIADPAFIKGITTRVNDWTAIGVEEVDANPQSLIDTLVCVQFPWLESYGDGTPCSNGLVPRVTSEGAPLLDTWFATGLADLPEGDVAVLTLAWNAADVPLTHLKRFYLDAASIVMSGDMLPVPSTGTVGALIYIEPLPWLTGLTFCGQWGVFSPGAEEGLCTSSGFRVHL